MCDMPRVHPRLAQCELGLAPGITEGCYVQLYFSLCDASLLFKSPGSIICCVALCIWKLFLKSSSEVVILKITYAADIKEHSTF